MSDYHQYLTTLALQKVAAWAFAIGELPRLPEKHIQRRPHRGMLPDVDFSCAVPVPRRPGLITRLFRLFAGPRGTAAPASAAESGTEDLALGETERKSYVWVLDRVSDTAKPDAPAREKDRSRAA
jgi:hypothetical protein